MIFLLLTLLLVAIMLICVTNSVEAFENYPLAKDNIDAVYAKLYNIVFNEKMIYDFDYKKIKPTLTENSQILDAGTGTGKYYEYFFKNNSIIGVDILPEFIKYAKIRCPIGDFVIGNLVNRELFQEQKFSHVLCLLDTLYHNSYRDQAIILQNFSKWLKPNGYLFIHIFDSTKLVPNPRNYSTLYTDDHKNLHAYTEFQNFNHDAYYIKGDNEATYREKITMNKDKKVRFQNTKLFIPNNKKRTIKQIIEAGFKVIDFYKMEFYDETDIELYKFQKK